MLECLQAQSAITFANNNVSVEVVNHMAVVSCFGRPAGGAVVHDISNIEAIFAKPLCRCPEDIRSDTCTMFLPESSSA